MALKTKVKVGHVTNLSDARYCAGMGADFLGFPIDTLPGRGVSMDQMKDIAGWVSGPELVLEIDNSGQLEALKNYHDQFMFQLPYEVLKTATPPANIMVMMEATDWLQSKETVSRHAAAIRFIILKAGNLSGKELDSTILEAAKHFPVLLHFDFDINQLQDVFRWPVAGISLSGTDESKPGIKEYGRLAEILEALEVE